MSVSVVIPVFDEVDNLRPLYRSLARVLPALGEPFEVIFVDDGSTDGSTDELTALASEASWVKVVELRRNYGQSAALDAGFCAAAGEVIVTMDADGQNDPADIPMLLDRIAEGYDLVYGWRKRRCDPFLSRRLPSMLANRLINWMTRFPAHDLGCSLKAIRREIALELRLFGEMHRFIPVLAHWRGARSVEVVTRHHRRRSGRSKYGLSRTLRVILDLITVKYLTEYLGSPMRLFGGWGLACGLLGLCCGAATLWINLHGQTGGLGVPLTLTVLLVLTSVQLLGFGMIGEVASRIYFERREEQRCAGLMKKWSDPFPDFRHDEAGKSATAQDAEGQIPFSSAQPYAVRRTVQHSPRQPEYDERPRRAA